jgi:solute carrier family 20 (sodium-dependent phosphate transporter)
MTVLTQYLWIVIVGFVFAFIYAFGIGANDVANAFATVVASKSLTLKQAVFVAAIFEFAGAFLLGAQVTNTVRSKIFDVKLYKDEPEILMLGMFCTLITGSIMLMGATYFALPVSTTHTIVGCIMGFSIVAKGIDSIEWEVAKTIFISWVASPLCTGTVAFILFGSLKKLVLDSEHPFERAFYTFPIVLTITIGINVFYVLFKGMNNKDFTEDLEWYTALGFGLAAGLVVGVIWIFAWGPWARTRIIKHFEEIEAAEGKSSPEVPKGEGVSDEEDVDVVDVDDIKPKKAAPAADVELNAKKEDALQDTAHSSADGGFFKKMADNTYNQDLQQESFHESARAKELWDSQEVFDPRAEKLFTYVQVFTSCMDSFSHGANDVANAVAPLSAIVLLYNEGHIESKAPVSPWILAFGGLGIVFGLLLYGYKVIKSIGYKMTPITPSRGSMAELSTALFVATASFISVPVSTTQAQVGAVAGIGLVGGIQNVQWLFFFKVCLSWVVVFFGALCLNAAIFSMFAYTPSLAAAVPDETDAPTMVPTLAEIFNFTNSTN